jgi:hypothetical protein
MAENLTKNKVKSEHIQFKTCDLGEMKTVIKWDKITVHCTDSKNGKSVSVDEIRSWHKDRGFSDIGYHFVIDIDGSIHRGRPVSKTGAHVEGFNQRNLGVCLVGKNKFSIEQFRSLKGLCSALQNRFGIDRRSVYCHYEFKSAKEAGKTCPNIKAENIHAFLNGDDSAIEKYLTNVKA